MSELIDINSKYTFWKLLSEYRVVIPIIQRDYAQGRTSDNATAIREEFLESIYNALISGEGLDFDFVYGTVEGDTLYPLDGQQRLTTFFLLHWYLAEKEGRMDDAVDVLSRFTYKTRISSREFCEMLMDVEYEPKKEESVSKFIKNENGYFRAWDTDPTISHMLTMLDDIHNKFFEADALFDSLTSDEEELLTFNFRSMEHYALTDDLYIKMNARGKALSIFENFKAKFIQHMKENDLPYDHFEENIDGSWTDLLWEYRDEDNTIDDQFMNLFCFITEMLLLETSEPREGDSPFRPTKIRGLIDYYQDEESVEDLYEYLDLWESKEAASSFLDAIFTTEEDDTKVKLFDNQTDIFSSIINGENVSLPSKLLLFSVMKRLVVLGKDADIEKFKDYIRIIRNFLLNNRSFARKRCSFSSEMRYGRHGVPIMQNFIDVLGGEEDAYVALNDYDFEDINSEVCELEKQKAKIILERPDKKDTIQRLEDLDLFRSSIFNVIPYVLENDDEYLVGNLQALSDYHDPKLIQALLSFKDYGIKTGSSMYGDRYFYGYEKNWYSIFSYPGGDLFINLISTFVEQYQNTESDDIDECLDEIIAKNLPEIKKTDWRHTIVKYYNTVKNYPGYMDHPYFILAKEYCRDGSYVVHRINGFIMNGYHVVPEYYEIKEQLGDLCTGGVRSYGCDEENEGRIVLSCVGGLNVGFNSEGGFGINHREEDEEWVVSTIDKYDAVKTDDMDKVEKCVLLCKLFDEKAKEVYGS